MGNILWCMLLIIKYDMIFAAHYNTSVKLTYDRVTLQSLTHAIFLDPKGGGAAAPPLDLTLKVYHRIERVKYL